MEIRLSTELQKGGADYRITIRNLTDLSGNPMDQDYNNLDFSGSALPDTVGPRILTNYPKDSSAVLLPNDSMRVDFNEAIDTTSFRKSFSIQDTLGNKISGEFGWKSKSSVLFRPDNNLASSGNYIFSLILDRMMDVSNNAAAKDSTLMFKFRSVNQDTFASISGTIIDEDSIAKGRIYLSAKQQKDAGAVYETELNEPGPYVFPQVLPGSYTMQGFRDTDGNGKYSFGQIFPYHPAERFFYYADSIKVRSKWPNEGNDITLK